MRACVAILTIAACVPALAEPTRDAVMAGAQRCYGIADNHAWLDCFYGSAQPMRSLLGLAPAPPAQVKLVPPPGASYMGVAPPPQRAAAPPPRAESDGFFGSLLGTARPVVANTPMAAYELRANGFIVTLPDGQRWQQSEGDTRVVHWNKPASTYVVTISSGALNSYNLRVKGDSAMYKVRRMR
jgi:hypothetical protein